MKRLLLGLTLLAIIFIAILCKPIDNHDEELLIKSAKVETIAEERQ